MTDKVTIEHAHSPLGPSAAERWISCEGSVLLTKDMESPDTEYSALGTAAHTLSEWCRVHKTCASTYRGQVLEVGGFEFEVDDEMIDAVNAFVEYVEQWPGEALYEERVHLDAWVPGAFGTMDDARITDNLCRVTDYKHGVGVQVFAHENAQLKLYALGLYHDWRHLYEFDKFVLTIFQPRLDHVDTFETTLADLLAWAREVVMPAAARALQPGAPLKAGDHCVFCPARRVCKVREAYVVQAVFGDFADDTPQDRSLLTPDEIAAILPKLSTITKWCNDIKAHATDLIAKGQPVGDWKLVEGRSNRTWKGGEDVAYEALALEVDDPDALWDKKLITPPQFEKKFGKKADISDLIYKPKGKATLAPGSSKKESVSVDLSTEFGEIE